MGVSGHVIVELELEREGDFGVGDETDIGIVEGLGRGEGGL